MIFGPVADGSVTLAEVFTAPNREANRALIVEAVNSYDRLRAIEDAARRYLAAEREYRGEPDPDNRLFTEYTEASDALREALR